MKNFVSLLILIILSACQVKTDDGSSIIASSNSYVTTLTATSNILADGVASSTVSVNVKQNGVASAGVVPTLAITGSNNVVSACSSTDANGDSTCSIKSTKAEMKTVAVKYPGSSLPALVTFIAGSSNATASSITASGPTVANGTSSATVSISIKDTFNNPIAGVTPTFSATDTGSTNIYGTCSATSAAGLSTCSLKSTKAEVKTLNLLTPVSKTGGTAIFMGGTPVAANSAITGSGPVIADGISTSTITVTLKDLYNNPSPAVLPTFTATNSGSNNVYGPCSISGVTGVSTCTLKSGTAETKTLSLVTPFSKSDGTVVFNPVSVVADNSSITGTGPVVANGVATSTITITLKDINNTGVSGIVPTFAATNTGTTNVYSACSATNASGVSTCTLKSLTAETKTLSIVSPVAKDDGTVVFTAPVPSAANSSINGSSPVVANGIATSSITIILKDSSDVPVPGATPTFSATDNGNDNIYGTCSATSSLGISTCTLASLTAETKTLSIVTPVSKADGTVVFTNQVADPANSSITGTSPVVANGTASSTITITLKDSTNNAVVGVNPTFGATNTGNDNDYGTCTPTNASGVATCTLASLTAETKTLAIATPIIKTGGNVIFTSASADPANSSITGTGPVLANGTATSTITITLKDSSNNPVTGQTPTFSATDTGTSNTYGTCSATNASGVSTCTLTSTTAEVKTLNLLTPIVKIGTTVTFSAGSPDATNSTITGTSPVIADGSATSTVTITLKDANNNPVAAQTPTFSATDTGTTNVYGTCSASNASGVSSCTLSSTAAETKTLSIVTPVAKSDGTVVFNSASAVAANSTITGTTPAIANGTATSTVTITLKDSNNNPVSGQTPTFSATDAGTTNVYGTCSASNASGISTCTLASLKAESKILQIETPVVKAGGSVIFTAGTPDVTNSTITGTSPVIADGSATSTVTITIKDANNNPVSGQTPTFSATDTGTTNVYGTCSSTNATGVSTCTLSSTSAETKTLSLLTPVAKTGGTVVFTSASAVAANSTITGTTLVVADGSATSTITINLKDANNNPVSGQTPTFSADDTGTTNTYGTCSATNTSGISTCTLSSLKAEIKTLQIETPVVKAGGSVTFTAGTPVASASSISGTTPVIADGTATSTVTITLKDTNNNPVSGQTPTFSATDTATTNVYGTCSASSATGESTCTLASLKAEIKTLQIETPVVKAGGTTTFTADAPVAANSTITGTTPVVADGSATSTVTITLKDTNNNLVSGVTPTFSATNTGNTNTYGTCSASNTSGVSTCTLASLTAEVKTLSIATPFIKADGTVTFTPGGAVAATSTITGSGPVVADGSASSTVTITLKDANNNPVSGETPTFSATNTGTANTYSACSPTNTSGISTCTLKSTKAETKTLSITAPFTKTDGTVVFTAGAIVAANSSISGTSNITANGVAASNVSIILRDAFNNPVSGATPTFSATDTDSTNIYGGCSASLATGLSSCSLKSTKAEVKTLEILTPVAKTGTTVTFKAGAADPTNSTIIGSGPVTADGTTTSTIIITLNDAFNNPLMSVTPTFSATNSGSSNIYGACSPTDTSGVSNCTLASTMAETKTLSITSPINKTDGTVVFDVGAVSVANSSITGTGPVTADGTDASTVTITLKDAANNPVQGLTPTFAATNTGTTNNYGECSVTDSNGESTCSLTSTVAEVKTLSITSPVSRLGSTVTFNPGVPASAHSTITGTTPVVANNTDTSTITITIKDAFSNPIAGQTPTFSATNTGNGNTYGACGVTNTSGVSTCTLKSTKAEIKTLTITSPVTKADGTVTFNAGTAVAATSTITGTGPTAADGTTTSTITITLNDAFSNPVSGQTPTFTATNTGNDNIYGTCTASNATGVSTCTLASLTAETKALSIATPVSKTGGNAVFTAGFPVAANSSITGTGPVIANGSATSTITITLKDSGNNPVAGQTPTFSATDTGTKNTYGACSPSDTSGVSTCTLKSTKAEIKTLAIVTPVSKTGGSVTFTAGSAFATYSTISGTSNIVANGVATSAVTITLKDAFDNPVAGSTPTFTATNTSSTNTYGACGISDASGVSSCTLKSTVAEVKTLSIATPITKAGSTVTFIAGSPDAAQSDISGTTPVSADGVSVSFISITLNDAFGNPVSGIVPIFNATNTGNTNVYGACVATDATGLSTCSLASTTAEVKTLQLTSPVAVTGVNTVTFSSLLPVAANSSISGTTLVIADGTATSTVTITLKDSGNNPVAGQTPTFDATDTETTNAYIDCSMSDAGGVSTCYMTSTKAESKVLRITNPVLKSGSSVLFVAGAPAAAQSSISGTTNVIADGVAQSSVTITIKDFYGNVVSGSTPTFSATNTGTTNVYGSCTATDASGVSSCSLKSTKAESKIPQILTPVSKSGGAILFIAGPASVANSSITGTGPTNPDGTSTSSITITLKDAFMNTISGIVPTFEASGSNNTYGTCSQTTTAGLSQCTLASTTSETKTLSITAPISMSGGTVVFQSGSAVPENSTITGTGPVVADGTATSTITITLKDSGNNPVINQTPTFNAYGSNNTTTACSPTNSSGVSTCTLKSTKAETKTLEITAPIIKTDGTVVFQPGPASVATSTIVGGPNCKSNNTDICPVQIVLKDAFSNTIEGIIPTFNLSGTASTNTLLACTTTDSSGVSTCGATSTKAETKTFTLATPVSVPGNSVDFNPNGINIQVPIEMTDRGLASATTPTTGLIFSRTRTSLNTADYLAQSNTYYFEIVVDNTSGVNCNISLVNNAGTEVLDSIITVSSSTTILYRRFRVTWTPTTGNNNYRVKVCRTTNNSTVKVHSARMIVEQVAAIETKLYFPLVAGDLTSDARQDTTNGAATSRNATSYGQTTTTTATTTNNYTHWLRTDSKYDAIAPGSSWTLETVMSTSSSTLMGYAGLHDKLNNQLITGAETTTVVTTPTMSQVSFASNATNFNDGDTLELRLKSTGTGIVYLYKAGLWLKLKFLRKAEIPFRISQRKATTTTTPIADFRFLWEAGAWSNPTVALQTTAIRSGTTTIALQDHANSDSGTAAPTTPITVTGSTITPATTYGISRSGNLTLTNMNRYFGIHNSTSTSGVVGGAYLMIQATE